MAQQLAQDALGAARNDLANRIDTLARACSTMRMSQLLDQVETIRSRAHQYGLEPLERLAGTLETALAFRGHAPIVYSYLDLMRDAVDCDANGPDVSAAYLAALSLRVGA